MTSSPYRHAYDTALAEITEIARTVEQLLTRKVQVENLLLALQPFCGSGSESLLRPSIDVAGTEPAPKAGEQEPPAGYSFRDVPSPLPDLRETGGDPFQSRVKATFRFKDLPENHLAGNRAEMLS